MRFGTINSRSAPRRFRGDDGAVVVEFGLMVPVLALLAMGTIEFGMAWRSSMQVSTAARTAARVVTNTGALGGDDPSSDYNALGSLIATLDMGNVQKVIIYNATAADGQPPQACIDWTSGNYGGPVTENCNVYLGSWLDASFAATAEADWGCNVGYDSNWCPTGRVITQVPAADDVGVWIEYQHQQLTGMFGDTFTITDRAVHTNEPAPA